MLEKQRHHLLLEVLAGQGFASVHELAVKLNASEATIRRDLTKLAQKKLLMKIRGGAESLSISSFEVDRRNLQSSDFQVDVTQHQDRKAKIAAKAVSLCTPDDSIIINGGSSTFMMKDELAKREGLKVLTNSFALAYELSQISELQVTLPGGELYRQQSIILSSFENDSIPNYHGTKMFMGTPGIGEFGVMEADPLLVRSEQKLKKQAEKLVVLADSSKIGLRSSLILCPLSDVDIIITDSGVTEKYVSLFEDNGVEVIVVDD